MSQLGKILFLFAGVSFVSFAIVRFILGAWVPFLGLALGLFTIFFVGGLWLERKFIREFAGMKTTKQGFSMGSMVLLVVSLIVALNILGARRYKTWDFSMAQVNSLSDQSVKLLDSLNGDLKVLYFYKEGTEGFEQNRRSFIELMKKYQDHSPKVRLEFVEVNSSPALAEKYDIKKGTQSVILEYEGRTNMIEKIDEQEITSAIVKVTRTENKTVYLLSGHWELSTIQAQDGNSASFLKSVLEGNRYAVKDFSFSSAGEIPKDAAALMILGPEQQLLDIEMQAVENYLSQGGSVFLALEPRTRQNFGPLLAKLGLKLSDNYVVSTISLPVGRIPDPRFTRGSVFSPSNPITKPFSRGEYTVFRFPQSLERLGSTPPAGLRIDDIVRSDENSFETKDLTSRTPGKDGPYTLVAAVQGKWPGASADAKDFNLVVAGDREFLNDQSLYQNLNRDLVLNSVSVLAKEENMVSISPKEVSRTEMIMLDSQFYIFLVFFIIPLPLFLYVLSGVLWWRRRHA